MSEAKVNDLRDRLLDLLEAVGDLRQNSGYAKLFDEFIREYEFGLALETICDFLTEPDARPANPTTIRQIEQLHQLMGVEDDCVTKVKKKANLP